jgi:hypothetical protein
MGHKSQQRAACRTKHQKGVRLALQPIRGNLGGGAAFMLLDHG